MSKWMECGGYPLTLSKLKGIEVYYSDDLYEFARLMVKLMDARDSYERPDTKSRPTVYGLVKQFAQLIDPCYPPTERVLAVVKKHGLPLDKAIELDEILDEDREGTSTCISNCRSATLCPLGLAPKRKKSIRKKPSTDLSSRNDLIWKLHNEGVSYRQIAERFGISKGRVEKVCKIIELREKWPEFRKLLSVRAQNILLTYFDKDEEIFNHPERIAEFDLQGLLSLKNMGRKTAMEVAHALNVFGYSLGKEKNSFPEKVVPKEVQEV